MAMQNIELLTVRSSLRLFLGAIYGTGNEGESRYVDAADGVSPDLYFLDLLPQNLSSIYGKVLRIDVNKESAGLTYGIPETNPFANNSKNFLPEIYAWGFRNPYSISFDNLNFGPGDNPTNGFFPFWISSSSETLFEATHRVDEPGNFGWPVKEGSHCFSRANPLTPPDVISCSSDVDCINVTVYIQKPSCGGNGRCTCNMVDAENYTMINPVIEYVSNRYCCRIFGLLKHCLSFR